MLPDDQLRLDQPIGRVESPQRPLGEEGVCKRLFSHPHSVCGPEVSGVEEQYGHPMVWSGEIDPAQLQMLR